MSLFGCLKTTSERPFSPAVLHVDELCQLTEDCGFIYGLDACKSVTVDKSLSVPGPKKLI